MRAYLEPRFDGPDKGEGGIRQVTEHLRLPMERLGVEFVGSPDEAEIIAYNAAPMAETRRWIESRPHVPVVSHDHGLYWLEYEWGGAEYAANALVTEGMRLADAVTAPTEWVANAIRRGMAHDVRAIPHGVDMTEFRPAPAHADYILWDKTRVDPVCDPRPLIALAQALPDQRFLTTAGAPENAGDWPVNVELRGRLPYGEARELTRNAGLYLCTSRETFGLATLQAMAAGVPVVGYRFGGQAEIIRGPEDGGLLVPVDDVGALAAAVGEALTNREALAAGARKRAREYPWKRAAEAYVALYQEVIDRKRAAWDPKRERVSVLITSHNLKPYVGRAVQSALAQGPDVQVIVVDDASTDGSQETLTAIKAEQPRLDLLLRTENGYLARARNDGLKHARGRYVIALDADDELPPGACKALADALDKDRRISIAYGKVQFWDDTPLGDGSIQTSLSDYGHGPGKSPWPFQFDWSIQSKGDNVTCLPYASMIRREWLERVGGWRERCRTGEDIDLWQRLIGCGARPQMVTGADVLTYHTRVGSMSTSTPLGNWALWYPWTEAAGPACYPPFGVAAPPPERTAAWPVSHHAEPLVSVVIPVGPGHERLVIDALDSVDAQTWRDWECIVVDDTELGIPWLPVWARRLRAGAGNVGAARDLGISVATGRYVVLLDADDYLQPDALQWLVGAIEQDGELAVVYPDYWAAIDGKFEPNPLADWDPKRTADTSTVIHGITAIYRRDAILDAGGFDPEAPAREDADLQLALAAKGYCSARLPLRLYVYRIDTGKRRDADMADPSRVVEWFRAKWGALVTGEEEPMACRSCGGTPRKVNTATLNGGGGIINTSAPGGETQAVEYLGAKTGTFQVRGSSGVTYRFAQNSTHRVAYVLQQDLDWFRMRPREWRVVDNAGIPTQTDDAQPAMVAPGPPSGVRV